VILTFGANCGPPGPTLSDPNGQPSDVAFDNKKDNIVYVSDTKTNGIDVYEKGATSPTRTLYNSAITGAFGVAVDGEGNVYQAGANSAKIVEFPHGKQSGSAVLSVTGLSRPIGLEFDVKGNLLVIDYNVGVLVYTPPFNGAPARTISTKGSSAFGKLDKTNQNVYVGDLQSGSADVYAYPSGTYEYSITKGLKRKNSVEGIAVDPPSAN
jgi:hypothetical protein